MWLPGLDARDRTVDPFKSDLGIVGWLPGLGARDRTVGPFKSHLGIVGWLPGLVTVGNGLFMSA